MLLEVVFYSYNSFSPLLDDVPQKSNLGTSAPHMDNVNRTPQQNTMGTLAVPINAQSQQLNPNTATTQGTQPSRFGQIFRQPKEGNPPQDPHALQGQVQGIPSVGANLLKTGLEKELQKSAPKHSVDLLLLQLKNDVVCKIEARPSSAQGLLFQTKIEINDIIINLDPEIVVSIFEYQSEINKIHQIRCAQLKEFGSSYFDELKFEAEKQIITFQNRPRGTLTPQKGNIGNLSDFINFFQKIRVDIKITNQCIWEEILIKIVFLNLNKTLVLF